MGNTQFDLFNSVLKKVLETCLVLLSVQWLLLV